MTSLITAMEEHGVQLEMEMKEEVREREKERVRKFSIGSRVTSSPVPLSHSESVWHGCR